MLTTADITAGFSRTDFWVYWSTAGDWLDGESIYDPADPFGGYLYPPIYLLFFTPFAMFLTLDGGYQLWMVLSIGGLWIAMQALIVTYVPTLNRLERIVIAIGSLSLLFCFHPVWYGMRLGQVTISAAALVTIAVVAMERQASGAIHGAISGILTAVVGTVKLFYAPVGAHLLLSPLRFAWALLAGVLLLSGSLLIFGMEVHLNYLEVLRWGEDWGEEPSHPASGWIPGYYRPFYYLGHAHLGDTGLPLSLLPRLIIVIGIISLAMWVRNEPADREIFALGIVAIPLLSPQISVHDFALLIPSFIMLTYIEVRRGGYPWIPIFAILLIHWQAYATFALANAPEWVMLAGVISTWSPLLQPGVYANFLLVGLAAGRALEYRIPEWLDRQLNSVHRQKR